MACPSVIMKLFHELTLLLHLADNSHRGSILLLCMPPKSFVLYRHREPPIGIRSVWWFQNSHRHLILQKLDQLEQVRSWKRNRLQIPRYMRHREDHHRFSHPRINATDLLWRKCKGFPMPFHHSTKHLLFFRMEEILPSNSKLFFRLLREDVTNLLGIPQARINLCIFIQFTCRNLHFEGLHALYLVVSAQWTIITCIFPYFSLRMCIVARHRYV